MGKISLQEALGGLVDVLVNLIILDARGVPYEITFNAMESMPKQAMIELGQQFNYPLMAEIDGEVLGKIKAVVTDLPQHKSDGVTMVATIMDQQQVHAIRIDPMKDALADTITTSMDTFPDLVDKFKKGNPKFRELSRRYL